jgi:glycosyltransferase involved in cell wall biosynthesis
MKKKNLLIHPGFLIDTWSSIEQRYIWLDQPLKKYYNVYWLVPPTGSQHSRYTNPEYKNKEPIFVTKLKEIGATLIECDLSKYNQVKNYALVRKIFVDYNIDAIFTHFDPLRYFLEIIAKIKGVKIIRGEHSHTFIKERRYKFFKWFIYKFATDYYVSVSKSVQQHLIDKGLQKNNGCVVYDGFDLDKYPGANKQESFQSIIQEFNLPANTRIISCIAKIDTNKRQHVLIDMLNRLKQTDLVLMLVGAIHDEQYIRTLDDLIDKHGLNDKVVFCGYRFDVPRFLDASEISYLASSHEGLGNVIIESYIMHTPVIASDIPPIREIIDDGVNGYRVNTIEEYCEKTLELLGDSEKRRKFAELGCKKMEQMFSRSVFIDESIKSFFKAFNYFERHK